jgi:hypothetical protein
MEYKEIYRKKLNFVWKLKRISILILIVGGLAALAIWILSQQEGLMIGRVLQSGSGKEIFGK